MAVAHNHKKSPHNLVKHKYKKNDGTTRKTQTN